MTGLFPGFLPKSPIKKIRTFWLLWDQTLAENKIKTVIWAKIETVSSLGL